MSIKIVVFGEAEQVTKFGIKSRGAASDNGDDIVAVETLAIQESNFLLFSVKDRSLVSAQASGANGIFGGNCRITLLPGQRNPSLRIKAVPPGSPGVQTRFRRGTSSSHLLTRTTYFK